MALVEHIVQLWGRDSCGVFRCAGCGLRFAWPFVAGDGRFYNLAYPHSAYPTRRWEFDQTLVSISGGDRVFGHVLEIGSGFGYFLDSLAPRFVKPENAIAVEYSEAARDILRRKGYATSGEDVRSSVYDRWRGQIEAIFMFQVLEHMDDLYGLLSRLSELASRGADWFVAVPNSARIAFNEAHGSLLDMPPNHISCWTLDAFVALASRGGWRVVEHRSEPISWRRFLIRDLVYSHMRRAQQAGSIANRARAMARGRVRTMAEASLAMASAPTRLRTWSDAIRLRQSLGDSIWLRLIRN